ncbi:MAG: metallophosphoesterase, partial [Chloroflexota bacterium]
MKYQTRFRSLLCLLCALCLAPSSAQQASLVRFAVIGDSGTGKDGQYRVAEQMVAWHDRRPYELVLMLGDNIYGWLWRGGRKQEFADKFDRPYAELLRRGVVFRAALGNHDMYTRRGGNLIESYERFHIDGAEGYYRFTAGEEPGGGPLVEFFVLNSTRLDNNKHDPAQLAWLEEALAASTARWRIAYLHHPLYSTGASHGEDKRLRVKLEPLFHRVAASASSNGPTANSAPRVQVVLSGHDHIYQRFHPQQGIVYFVLGSSGKLRRENARPSPAVAAVNDQ